MLELFAVIGGAVTAGAMVALSRVGRRADKQLRAMLAEVVDIGRANVPGRVVLSGRVVRREPPLLTPHSRRECAFYSSAALVGGVVVRNAPPDLEIEDDSGRARLELSFAEVDLTGAASTRIALGLVVLPTGAVMRASAREHLLVPGDRVLVAGIARRRELDPTGVPTGGGVFREAAARIVVEGTAEAPVVVRFRR